MYSYMNLSTYKKATASQLRSLEERANKLRPEIEKSIREKEEGALVAAKLKVY